MHRTEKSLTAHAKHGAIEARFVTARAGEAAPPLGVKQPDANSEKEGQDKEKKEENRELRDEFEAMCHAMPDLNRLVRYERRAWSRRKRAIHSFIEIKSKGGDLG